MDRPSRASIQALSKENAQQAFIKYASEKCCYSKRPAEEGVITNMEDFSTYRYRLETFTETRTTERSQRPYFGEVIETGGQPPRPWEIPVDVPPFFHYGRKIIEVPNTASVKYCRNCFGQGVKKCMMCSGNRTITCCSCNGQGQMAYMESICYTCGGRGTRICSMCRGVGVTICYNCAGRGKVVVAINLVVKWVNNIEDHTVEQASGLKMAKLDKVLGMVVFKETNNRVYPVTSFDLAIVQASNRLLRKHREKYQYSQDSRILQQRHTIALLPISKVTYEWSEESHVFFVYGVELKVSAEDYPAACCCCCRCCCTVM